MYAIDIDTHIQIPEGTDALEHCERYAAGLGGAAVMTLDPQHAERCLRQASEYAALAELIAAANRYNIGRGFRGGR
jgi:hypothetical protein